MPKLSDPNVEAPSTVRVADVVFAARAGGGEAHFTYALPFEAQVGDLVLAPLAARPLVGVITRAFDASPGDLGFPLEKLRALEGKVFGLRIPPELLETAQFIAESYLCPLPVAVGPLLPPGIGDRLSHSWELDEAALLASDSHLTALQIEVVESARAGGGKVTPPKSVRTETRKAIRLLEAKRILVRTTRLERISDMETESLYRMSSDEERIESYIRKNASKKPAQVLTLIRLREAASGTLSLEDIKSLGGVTQTAVRSLVEAGLLEAVKDLKKEASRSAPIPNKHQAEAIEAISNSIAGEEPEGFLLFGVTGSGKTEVYLRAAAEALRQGKQVLYLVPEIALATQAIGGLRARFGESVAVLHSELSPKDRLAQWLRIASGEAPIVIGARSALFAPLSKLGLIVMDEEHEGSYKQESSPRYHAKTVVRHLAAEHGCPYVLGSATPSVESFYEASHGALKLLELPHRAAEAKLPEVEVEDLGAGFRAGHPALLSERLEELLLETVESKHQAILFLNRRAYAPFLVCRECGHFFMCPRCAVTLTFSRKSGMLRCHHCGHQERPPDACSSCRGSRLNPIGIGTEKVEEAVQALLPDARVARLDRDVAQRKGALESTLAAFGSGEIDVLVGTQIVAKGLNFPNVTLVGVITADVSLNLPEFRASERTFQLLSQVSGRAGRGDAPGRVVIQTFNPSHVAVQTSRRHDYRAFYDYAIAERESANYPPFRQLVNIVFAGADYAPVVKLAEEAARRLRSLGHPTIHNPQSTDHGSQKTSNIEILGPAPCVIERLQNRWRYHVLVKIAPDTPHRRLGEIVEDLEKGNVQVTVDVDPYSLM